MAWQRPGVREQRRVHLSNSRTGTPDNLHPAELLAPCSPDAMESWQVGSADETTSTSPDPASQ